MAKTPSSSTSRSVACTASAGSETSSTTLYEIVRPLTPPRALTYRKYAPAPRTTAADGDCGSERVAVPPSRIVVTSIPGSLREAAVAPAASTPASRSSAALTSATVPADRKRFQGTDESRCAIREREHDQDQDDTE